MSRRRYKRVSHGVDKSTMTYMSEDETGPFSRCQSMTRSRHNVKRADPPTHEVCLIYRIFPCIPYWTKKRPASDDDEVEVKDVLYSEEEVILDKKRILQSKERAQKLTGQKLKEQEETCKRYKLKAKEIERQLEIFEEEIKRKRAALRKKPEPSNSDEEIARVLNTLLCTKIHFDPEIISKIKVLLEEKPKLQGYFNECSHNNMKYKLFSRVGIDSKLKFFLNSKKRMNAEQRELLGAIMDQVNKEYGDDEKKKNRGDTMIDKIYRILWRRPERHSAGAPVEQQSQRMPQEQVHIYPGSSSQNSTRCKVDDHRGNNECKRTIEGHGKNYRQMIHSENEIAMNVQENRLTNKTLCKRYHQRSRSHERNMGIFKGYAAQSRVSLHKSFHLKKSRVGRSKNRNPYKYETDVEEEIRTTKLGQTRQLTVMTAHVASAPRFDLLRFFKNDKPRKKGKKKDNDMEYDDMLHNGRRRHCQKCFLCDKATETDACTQYLTDFNQSDVSSEDLDEEMEEKKTGDYRFWNLFKRDS